MAAFFDFISIQAFALAWVIHMIMGAIWYSPSVFGKAFLRLTNRRAVPEPKSEDMIAAAVGSAMALPFFSFILSVVGCGTSGEGALWGLAFGFFFDSGLNAPHSFFEDRPFPLFVLHRGYHIVSLSLIGTVLGKLCGTSQG